MVTLATAQAAVHEAKRSEEAVLKQLSEASRGSYLNPSSFTESQGDSAAHASLDAHIKKVQAEQLRSMSSAQINAVVTEDHKLYVGRKVRITSLDKGFQPFDGVWFDAQNGVRYNTLKKSTIEGRIENVDLQKNMLIIQPKRAARLLNSSLRQYVIYVINPQTLVPAVEISLK